MGAVTYETLEHVAMDARAYPVGVLPGSRDGLVLFAAAFLGHNDAIHFANAGLWATCIDTDGERLAEMRKLYPRDWLFMEADAWEFAEAAREEELSFDVVSLDPFTGDMMDRVRADLELWTSLANRAVVLGVDSDLPEAMLPAGWEVCAEVKRSEIASWLVLGRS